LPHYAHGKTPMLNQSKHSKPTRLVLFCKVVDNFGDIGICWRFARQLVNEHNIQVDLWVDDLKSFQRICPTVDFAAKEQCISQVNIIHWQHQDQLFSKEDIADIVIEFFACDIPPHYIQTMAQCEPCPVWINFEGLSAEEWVEGCHTLLSSHPTLPITKYFFFPGFNTKTGGLLFEASLKKSRETFLMKGKDEQSQKIQFLQELGLSDREIKAFKVSLFCYPHAPILQLFETWQNHHQAITCLIPEGVAQDAIKLWSNQTIATGDSITRGSLTLRVIPFMPQDDYDKLLWSCELNFVRGEDSFVRAQWAGQPFIWHIYPQDDNLHHKKLKVFLSIYEPTSELHRQLSLAWNNANTELLNWPQSWQQFLEELPNQQQKIGNWEEKMHANGDFASNLLKFAKTKQ
jgi:uncharacterized repeat protein (TIGR03837 family)